MKVAEPPDAYGYTTFCDDIRMELGGKITLVGVYGGQMVLAGPLPGVLPKLALHISYRQRYDRIVLPVQFRVFFPWDDPEKPMVIDIPDEGVQSAAQKARLLSERGGEVAFSNVTFQFSFVPFVIMGTGVIRVRAVRGDELVRLGGIEIIAPRVPAAPQPQT
jgi:hypothetical protein